MPRKHEKISEQLRHAVLNAEVSRYRIAKETGLTEAALSRFVNGVAGLSLDSIDRIGECLGLRLTVAKTKHSGKVKRMAKRSDNASAKRTKLLKFLEEHRGHSYKAVGLLYDADVDYPKNLLRSLLKGHVKMTRRVGYWWYQSR